MRPLLVLGMGLVSLLACGRSTAPEWSDDHLPVAGEVLFLSGREGGGSRLFLLDANGVTRLPVLPGDATVYDAYWSHDGETIAYTVDCNHGASSSDRDIYLLEHGGTAGWPLVSSEGSDWEPRWSPDDARIAFLSERETPGPGVYTINADGSEERRVLAGEFPDDWGSWSPDGESIVVGATPDEPMRVVALGAADTTRLVVGSGPAFSPGGEWIAYYDQGIHLIKPDASEQRTLTDYGDGFRWSPDGQYLSFRDRNPYTPYSLEIVGVDGKDRAVLVEYPESWKYIRHHSWSPDQDYIVYCISLNLDNTQSAVFVVSLEDTTAKRVTHYEGIDRRPEWRPGG